MDSLFYTREEARRKLGIGLSSLDEAIRKNDVPARRLGRRVLIPKAAIDDLATKALERPKS